ncbi:MAG: hypothetical protein ABIS03_04285, partial [Gemmatimonadaceae bacterium]
RLAGLRYGASLTDLSLARDEALESLRAARQLDEDRISSLPYAMAYAAIVLPGARRVLKSRPMNRVRRTSARLLGVLD